MYVPLPVKPPQVAGVEETISVKDLFVRGIVAEITGHDSMAAQPYLADTVVVFTFYYYFVPGNWRTH